MIPKKIHYCWFGRNPKPELFEKCIKSWRKYCPDFEIIEWNEDNFDVNIAPYAKEAYDAKKWAFVTDFARLWIVYNHGGVYLDTDVEIVRPLDTLLDSQAYFGFEDEKYIATGLGFGAEKGNPVVGLMLDDYNDIHFVKEDSSFDLTTCPVRNTGAVAHLLPPEINSGSIVRIERADIYPKEYFCPHDASGIEACRTNNTYSIHWYSATWLSDDEQIVHQYRVFCRKCEKMLGKRMGGYLARFVYLFKPKKRAVLKRM